MEATPSVQPVSNIVEVRDYGYSQTIYPMPYLTNENKHLYKNAYEVDQKKMLDLMAVIQEHVDQGISVILFVNSDITTRELARYYIYAHHKGLKSLYYTRNKLLSVEECTSCSI